VTKQVISKSLDLKLEINHKSLNVLKDFVFHNTAIPGLELPNNYSQI
jgi:hypothetical protein